MKRILVLASIVLFPCLLNADTIKLKSGTTVEGKILEETDEFVRIDVEGVELTLYRSEIDGPFGPPAGPGGQKVFDKVVLKASDLKNTGASKETVLKEIRGKAARNRNLSFEYELESFSGEGRREIEKGKVFIRDDKTWRSETESEFGGKGFKIRNGDDVWSVETVKFVRKSARPGAFDRAPSICPVFTNWNNREAMGFDLFFMNPVGTGSLFYRGEEDVDGEPCYVLEEDQESGQVILWIAKGSGTLKKYLMVQNSAADPRNAALQTETSWTVNVKKTGFVRQVKWDQDFDDALFRYVLKEGDHVEEENEVNGETVTKEWVVPYKGSELSPEKASETNRKLDEITKKYNEVKGYSCVFSCHEKDEKGVKIGSEGGFITPEKTQTGLLKFMKPSKLSYVYDVKSNVDYENVTGSFVMTDGEDYWDFSIPPRAIKGSPADKYVIFQKVKDMRSLRADMLQSAEKFKERAQRFQEPGDPGLVVPPEMESHELVCGSYSVKLPAFALEPFKNIGRDGIIYQGTENIRGEETYRFLVKESADHRKSMHWIGAKDGIPRRIQEYDWVGELVSRQMDLSDVKVDPVFKDADFVFKNDNTFQIQDMSAEAPGMAKMLKQSFDTPPEDTFAMNFDMPAEKVENLKGSGMFFRGGEAFIRFNCSGDVVLKDAGEFIESPQDMAETADYFRKSFPEDAEALQNTDELSLRKYVKKSEPAGASEEGKLLLANKKRNTYFFKMWFWAD